MAASDRVGTLTLYSGPDTHTGLTTVVSGIGFTEDGEVPAAPLTEVLTADEIGRARLIKIDVEGGEVAVVPGLERILDEGRGDLEVILEVHTLALEKQGVSPEDLLRPFTQRGFNVYSLENDYRPVAYLADRFEGRAVRKRDAIDWEMNIVLSRVDAESI